MQRVAIIDYGSGNLHSAAKAFERSASVVRLSDDPVNPRFVPPYMIRKVARHGLSAIFSANGQMRRFHLVRAAASLGEIKGHLQARRDRRGRDSDILK